MWYFCVQVRPFQKRRRDGSSGSVFQPLVFSSGFLVTNSNPKLAMAQDEPCRRARVAPDHCPRKTPKQLTLRAGARRGRRGGTGRSIRNVDTPPEDGQPSIPATSGVEGCGGFLKMIWLCKRSNPLLRVEGSCPPTLRLLIGRFHPRSLS